MDIWILESFEYGDFEKEISNGLDHMNTELFGIQTAFDRLITGLIPYLDPHCYDIGNLLFGTGVAIP